MEKALLTRFSQNGAVDDDFFGFYTTNVLQLPLLLKGYVAAVFQGQGREAVFKITKSELAGSCRHRRAFDLIKGLSTRTHLQREDFTPLVDAVIAQFEDCAMLREEGSEAFRKRYQSTVVETIFFALDFNDDGKIEFGDFLKEEFLGHLERLNEKLTEFNYFNYDAFYVLCRIFDDLNTDGEEHLTRSTFERFNNHALSTAVVERIFNDAPRKLSARGKMSFEDFVRFGLCEEEKGAP